MEITLENILRLREAEDRVEFKEAHNGFSFKGGDKSDQKERRKSVMGYVVALANEGGGLLVFGIKEGKPPHTPHTVVGTNYREGLEGTTEAEIFVECNLRVKLHSLFDEQGKRVLVFEIPSHPIAQVLLFDDVALMRVGDRLERMSEDRYRAIINEQEPDFSAKICQGLTLNDLETSAIETMKQKYALKQDNPTFRRLSNEQVLNDLDLVRQGKLTYAALILLGKEAAIKQYLPQATIWVEYRVKPNQIRFDNRKMFMRGFFAELDEIWKLIDSRNGFFPIRQDAYIFDMPNLNEEVVREALLNAVAHRDYAMNSEIVIKQYPEFLEVSSAGGFPFGVTLKNIITVSSTPRNRLIADVFLKTGLVERSGQGVDKIYRLCISEAKGAPKYLPDAHNITLRIPAVVEDTAFLLFLQAYQQQHGGQELSAQEVIELEKIRQELPKKELNIQIVKSLEKYGLVESYGQTSGKRYILSKEYYSFTQQEGSYSAEKFSEQQAFIQVQMHFAEFTTARMNDIVRLLHHAMTRDQIRYLVDKWVNHQFLERIGTGVQTTYKLGQLAKAGQTLVHRAMELGLEQMKQMGELPSNLEVPNNSHQIPQSIQPEE